MSSSSKNILQWIDRKPRVVATLLGPASLLNQAKKARRDGADILELRADSLSRPDLERIVSIMSAVKKASRLPILLTVRDPKEQGSAKNLLRLSDRERLELFCRAIPSSDLLDIEIGSNIARDVLKQAKKSKAKVILSYHDFTGVPGALQIQRLARQFKKLKGDILKIAGFSKDRYDILGFLREGLMLSGIRKTFIAMGELGQISRLAGFCFGSCLTYGFAGSSAAPGQVPVKDLAQIYKLLGHYR